MYLHSIFTEERQAILLRLLPRLFGEKLLCWIISISADLEDIGNRITVYPTIVAALAEDGSVSSFVLFVDRVRICSCVNVLNAVCVLFMSYYVFNIVFPKDLVNTFNFLDVYVARIGKQAIRKPVQHRLNFLT
jgi:hypothetical protein